MTGILTAILCFLDDMLGKFKDLWLNSWDSVLSPVDAMVSSIGTGGLLQPGSIADQYAWILGLTGLGPCIGIMAAAMLTRFVLQTIPFVRWGS